MSGSAYIPIVSILHAFQVSSVVLPNPQSRQCDDLALLSVMNNAQGQPRNPGMAEEIELRIAEMSFETASREIWFVLLLLW